MVRARAHRRLAGFGSFALLALAAELAGRGRYRIVLPAGYYDVTTVERVGIGRNIRPRAVHVRIGRDDRMNFSLDTGIR